MPYMAVTFFQHKLRSFLMLLLLCVAALVNAQVDNIYVYGTAKDRTSMKKMDGVTVTVFKDGVQQSNVITSSNGKYEFNLDYGHQYKLVYSKAGIVSRNVSIDTRNIPDQEKAGGLAMNVEMTLFATLPGMDFSLADQPIGISKFDPATGNLAWDNDYTTQMQSKLDQMFKDYDEQQKKAANADADFAKLMDAGNSAMTGSDYKKAVDSYTKALTLKPGDAIATAKLSDAQIKMGEADKAKQLDSQYAALIKDADALMGKKTYADAKAKYVQASALKDQEVYPKQKMKECDAFIADLAAQDAAAKKQQELDAKYKADIDAGDAAVKAAQYDVATAKFTEAGTLKPSEKYPPQQLAAITKLVADAKAAQAMDANYKAAITAADAAFQKADFTTAKGKYNEALGLKPKEKYPTDQLAAIDQKIADLAAKADADKKAKELDANYLAAITAADAAFQKADYDAAKGKYNDALSLKPKEKYPTDQLAAIDKKIADLAAKADADKKAKELDANYQAAITAADAAFQRADYDAAKGKYNDALGLKPKEKYPTDQLAAIDKKIADLAAQADADKKAKELDANYQAAIAAADASFKAADYDAAKGKYNEALGLKPKEKYPTDQLAAIDKQLADLAAKAAADKKTKDLDTQYNQLIEDGEGFFTAAKYADAKAKFQAASTMRPDEAKPKERIVEIDAKLAELARQADALKKQQELDAKYAALIASADKKFTGEDLSNALNDYQEASTLKPDEQYPKDRITAINGQLDAASKAQAEKDRLAREQQDKDKRFSDLVAQADQDFKAENYDAAVTGYTSALDVKPGEKHPTDRLAEIKSLQDALAAKAVADSAKAAQAAAVASAASEKKAQYDAAVAKADAAFAQQSYDPAREGYTEALGIMPDEKYPKDRIAAIDKALADAAKAQKDSEDAAEKQRLADAERQRLAQAAADSAQAAAAQDQQARDAAAALDEQYAKVIKDADGHMADKNLQGARDLYTQALDIKPKEAYPQTKIAQIDQLLAAQERAATAAALAAQATPPPAPVKQVSNLDSKKEQEAEEFMRDARAREEAEKYVKIKNLRDTMALMQADDAAKAAERQSAYLKQNKAYVAADGHLYTGSQEMRKKNEEELEALRAALVERRKEVIAKDQSEREQAVAANAAEVSAISETSAQWQQRSQAKTDAAAASQQQWKEQASDRTKAGQQRSDAAVAQTRSQQAAIAARQDQGTADLVKKRDEVQEQKESEENRQKALTTAGQQRTEAAMAQTQAQRDAIAARQDQGATDLEKKRAAVQDQKEGEATRQKMLSNQSEARTKAESDRLANVPLDHQRAYTDYNRNKLASQYPQGVTEESYTEGNKVIIRRVVVQGNKADEYSKVIAKWGTFYFENGQSISEQYWTVNTEQ